MTETKCPDIDEATLKRLWGNMVNQLTPEVKAILIAALKRVRENTEQQSH